MPYCVHCGAAVTDAAVPCPVCHRAPLPAAQSPAAAPVPARSGMSKSAMVAIAAAVGCLPAIVVLGIVAALIIPNFVDALNKARQQRTMADLREMQTILGSYSYEMYVQDPSSSAARYPDVTSMTELAAALAPYGEIAQVDAWKRPLRYSCARAAVGVGCNEFRVASAGRDGVFEHDDPWHYEPGLFARSEFDADIVVGSEDFVRQPEPRP